MVSNKNGDKDATRSTRMIVSPRFMTGLFPKVILSCKSCMRRATANVAGDVLLTRRTRDTKVATATAIAGRERADGLYARASQHGRVSRPMRNWRPCESS